MERQMKKNIELLAPAGSMECLKAAINAGCDAVYASGKSFGARAFAKNFDEENMIKAIDYVHLYGKKIYMTVNTLFKNNEIEMLKEYILPYYKEGVDAVIVQDLGVIKYLNKVFSDLAIHASTQMTLMTDISANELKRYGVNRIVTPRELSLDEIKRIRKSTDLEIETFIHGALCYCYSGQCLMSSMIGNRSGNRGRCAQPCRQKYCINNNNEKKYILSTKDLCSLELIDKLIESGITSFKIEGRMKKPEYVALVVSTYRKYIDNYLENGCITYDKNQINKDKQNLMDIYNRGGFTKGYFMQHNGKDMMSVKRPNHYGVKVGKVEKVVNNKCEIKLSNKVNGQDVLEIRANSFYEDSYEFTLKDMEYNVDTISTRFNKELKIKRMQEVLRVRNQKLIDKIYFDYINQDIKIPIEVEFLAKLGEKLRIVLFESVSNTKVLCNSDMIVTKADNIPVSIKRVEKQLLKFGETKYEPFIKVIDMDEDIFIPMGKINELRRNAVNELEEKIVSKYKRQSKCISNDSTSESFRNNNKKVSNCNFFSVLVNSHKTIDILLKYPQIKRVYIESYNLQCSQIVEIIVLLKSMNIESYIALPHILRYDSIDKILVEYEEAFCQCDGFLIRNLEGLYIAKKYNKKSIADYNMYSLNDKSIESLMDMNIDEYTVSIEASKKDIDSLKYKNGEILVYGYPVVMTSAQCVNQNIDRCTRISKNNIIKDEYSRKFCVKNICKYCFNLIYNNEPILLDNCSIDDRKCRIDFTDENEKKAKTVLEYFVNGLKDDKLLGTKGHFTRDVD